MQSLNAQIMSSKLIITVQDYLVMCMCLYVCLNAQIMSSKIVVTCASSSSSSCHLQTKRGRSPVKQKGAPNILTTITFLYVEEQQSEQKINMGILQVQKRCETATQGRKKEITHTHTIALCFSWVTFECSYLHLHYCFHD